MQIHCGWNIVHSQSRQKTLFLDQPKQQGPHFIKCLWAHTCSCKLSMLSFWYHWYYPIRVPGHLNWRIANDNWHVWMVCEAAATTASVVIPNWIRLLWLPDRTTYDACPSPISMHWISRSTYCCVCRYLYCDEILIETDTVLPTLYAAKKYMIPQLLLCLQVSVLWWDHTGSIHRPPLSVCRQEVYDASPGACLCGISGEKCWCQQRLSDAGPQSLLWWKGTDVALPVYHWFPDWGGDTVR